MSGLHALTATPDVGSTDGPVALFLHGYGSHEHNLASLSRWLPNGTAWASLRAPIALPHGGHNDLPD